jgi:hypothetical protein
MLLGFHAHFKTAGTLPTPAGQPNANQYLRPISLTRHAPANALLFFRKREGSGNSIWHAYPVITHGYHL